MEEMEDDEILEYPYKHPRDRTDKYTRPIGPEADSGDESDGLAMPAGRGKSESFSKNGEAKDVVEDLKAALEVTDLKFEKVLGWGGNGVVCLFSAEISGSNDGQREYFAVKAALEYTEFETTKLEKEKDLTAKFVGAMHCIQLRTIQSDKPIHFKEGAALEEDQNAATTLLTRLQSAVDEILTDRIAAQSLLARLQPASNALRWAPAQPN
ncbi:hypothetical protein QBC44DRAFT_374252 [Cladorrhinum sp. PSN332]|nr:hypothetical protein QBC44DRAFT_374252 [Cladorrhinum sp. PSN332]